MPGLIKANSSEADIAGSQNVPFPVEALPPLLAEITRAIHDTTGTPLDICAPCVLATASACLGSGLLVNSAPGRVSAPNLYVLIVKPSGAGGSVAFQFATAPLRGWQATALREFDEVKKPQLERKRDTVRSDYDDAIKARRKLREKPGSTVEIEDQMDAMRLDLAALEAQLCPPYVLVSDCTPESLAHLLARRGEVLAHFDSDANDTIGTILGIRYGDGKHTTESLHLKAWSGESYAIARKGTARTGTVELFLKRPTLACLFIVTPDVAGKLFGSDRMTTGGLLPRFLAVNSQAKPLPWNRNVSQIASETSQRYEAACFAMLNTYRNRESAEVQPLEMTGEAFALFASHYDKFCKSFTQVFSAFDARHTENAMRIALVLHAWRNVRFESDKSQGTVARCNAHDLPLDGNTARVALRIGEWFENQQAAMLAPLREAARDEKFEKTFLRCERRRDWIVCARDLVTARIAETSDEADKLLATWENEGRAVRHQVELKDGPGAKPIKPRFRVSRRT